MPAFHLDARPVTNGEFILFVRKNPVAALAGEAALCRRALSFPLVGVISNSATRGRSTGHEYLVVRGESIRGFTGQAAAHDGRVGSRGCAVSPCSMARRTWSSDESGAGGTRRLRPRCCRMRRGNAQIFSACATCMDSCGEWTSDFNSAMVTGDARGDKWTRTPAFLRSRFGRRKGSRKFCGLHALRFPQQPARRLHRSQPRLRCANDHENTPHISAALRACSPPSRSLMLPPALAASKPTDTSSILLDSKWIPSKPRNQLGALQRPRADRRMFFTRVRYSLPDW